jgi:hypothetical protein
MQTLRYGALDDFIFLSVDHVRRMATDFIRYSKRGIEMVRDGHRREAVLELQPNWRGWSAGNWLTFGIKVVAQLVTFAVALLIAVRRPRERVTVVGALFLDQTLKSIVLSRGWFYAAVAGLALAVHLRRQRWLQALDRRFFRERYDAQRLLAQVVEDTRGTVHYMGPEQMRGIAAGIDCDLWAIAVMAYEMLAGALPFEGPTAADYQSSVLSGRFTPIRSHLTEAL